LCGREAVKPWSREAVPPCERIHIYSWVRITGRFCHL